MRFSIKLAAVVIAGVVIGAAGFLALSGPHNVTAAPQYVIYANSNLEGAPLRFVDVDGGESRACMQLCSSDNKCSAFVLSKSGAFGLQKPRCWLKTGQLDDAVMKTLSSDVCCTLGVKR